MKTRFFALVLFVSSFTVAAFAEDRLAKIGVLITSGRAAEARTQLQEAVAAYPGGKRRSAVEQS